MAQAVGTNRREQNVRERQRQTDREDWRDLYRDCFPMVKIPYPLRTAITHLQIAELAHSQKSELAKLPKLAHTDRMIEGRQDDNQTHSQSQLLALLEMHSN